MSFTNAIALTGGIATGKSSVCSLLSMYGFQIIDADKVAHQMLSLHVGKVEKIFGSKYIDNGQVNRKKLGSLIFANATERLKLEALLHPLIKEQIEKEAAFCENKNVPYIVDIPLFFENRNYTVDEVVLVYCDQEKQLKRLIEREGLSQIEAQNRINSQMNIDDKKPLASFVIDNTKDLRHLQSEVERFVEYIRKKYKDLRV